MLHLMSVGNAARGALPGEAPRQDRPDPGGIVRRGEAAEFVRDYAETYGEAPPCVVGPDGARCGRPATMQVYGLAMCGAHGEEAAAGALSEIAHDLENELGRPVNPHVRGLSPHLEAALAHGFGVLGEEARTAEGRAEALLLAAFPLDRGKADAESAAYAKDPDGYARRNACPPSDMYRDALMLVHRLMRLAFEGEATYLVETLEGEREKAAAQAAYALALEEEAGLRPGSG